MKKALIRQKEAKSAMCTPSALLASLMLAMFVNAFANGAGIFAMFQNAFGTRVGVFAMFAKTLGTTELDALTMLGEAFTTELVMLPRDKFPEASI